MSKARLVITAVVVEGRRVGEVAASYCVARPQDVTGRQEVLERLVSRHVEQAR